MFTFSQGYNNNLKIKPNSSLQHNCAVEFVWAKYNSENKPFHAIKIHINKERIAELMPLTWDLAEKHIPVFKSIPQMFKSLLWGQKGSDLTVSNKIDMGSGFVDLGLILCNKCAPKKLNTNYMSITQIICCMIIGSLLSE